MENSRLSYLFHLQVTGQATQADLEELHMLMAEKENEEEVRQLIDKAWTTFEATKTTFTEKESTTILRNVLQREQRPVRTFRTLIKVAAAIVIILAGTSVYLLVNRSTKSGEKAVIADNSVPMSTILPGSDKALLTLADGTVINLDSIKEGTIASRGNVLITKTADGKVIHQLSEESNVTVHGINIMSTPRGGQYKLRLPDGTEAWLNAASSVTYPTIFTGTERRVQITGEVYFEVAKNAKLPFRVSANGTDIVVLGTEFNVNAYPDESIIQTTLVGGAVQVKKGNSSVVLTPGQQANIDKQDVLTLVKDADIEKCLAWKNGMFIFKATNIRSIMRQVSRWYDVDVQYELPTEDLEFSGAVSRKNHVSEILKIMELTGLVKFRLEGKIITVTK